ncbi:hypothetical protein [Nocardioides sp. URHA0020]|uniref:hypothetical protein n=1 Tax=Nocardioides sp. URHA0020 TaxID=1380392 RepID=UPI0012DBF6E0|nr:hypothetical protein [Nocardioides sp. URHA0020]
MSGSESYPPPGGGAVEPPPPGWTAPPPPPSQQWGPPSGHPPVAPAPQWAPGMLGAAHRPGAMPLRPLGLGDIYDAAFRIIRFNPKATVGSAVIVASVAMAIPVVVTAVLTLVLDLSDDASGDDADLLGIAAVYGTTIIGSVLQYVGLIFVTGMIAQVTAAAAIGRRLSLGEAWAATRGSRWRLVGLTLLVGLIWIVELGAYAAASVLVIWWAGSWVAPLIWFVVTLPGVVALTWWLWIRVTYLPVAALAIERIGILAAIGRGYRLTRRQFWRTFGIALLTVIVTAVAAQIITVPFAILAPVSSLAISDPGTAVLVLVVVNAIGTVLSTAFVAPFTAAVTSVQYLDQRMRKEAYDVELMTRAGITAS